jgi:phosphoribosylanthranilate isomerase
MISIEEAIAVSRLGADHVGIMVSNAKIEYTVNPMLGKNICSSVRGASKCVMIPITHKPEEIVELALKVEPDIVQIASYEGFLSFNTFIDLSKRLRELGFKVTKVIPMGFGKELELAKKYSSYSDIIMLDTHGEPPSPRLRGFIGGTGKTHDWILSKKIVGLVSKPVILAGGLGLENVVRAIEIVRPWGVDAATKLNAPGSNGRKDIEKVRIFIEKAKKGGMFE